MDKKIKITVRLIIIIFLITGVVFKLTEIIIAECKYDINEFGGIVSYKHIPQGNHGQGEFQINNDKEWLFFIPELSFEYNIIQIGDSVHKNRGTSLIEVYRKNDDLIYKKIYPK